MTPSGKWYILRTEPHCEKKVVALLDKNKIQNYLPFNRIHRKWADRNKVIMEPLFPSKIS
jgi:Transcription termination factor nusG